MYEMRCDVAIIGGGPAGLSAAVAARKEGAGNLRSCLFHGQTLCAHGLISSFFGDKVHQYHHGNAQKHARSDACYKQLSDGNIGNGAVKNHGNPRRYQGCNHG